MSSASVYAWASALYSAFQVGVIRCESTSPKFAKEIEKTTLLFSLVDIGSLLVGISCLSQSSSSSWQSSLLTAKGISWNHPFVPTACLTACLTLTSCGMVYLLQKLAQKNSFQKEMQELRCEEEKKARAFSDLVNPPTVKQLELISECLATCKEALQKREETEDELAYCLRDFQKDCDQLNKQGIVLLDLMNQFTGVDVVAEQEKERKLEVKDIIAHWEQLQVAVKVAVKEIKAQLDNIFERVFTTFKNRSLAREEVGVKFSKKLQENKKLSEELLEAQVALDIIFDHQLASIDEGLAHLLYYSRVTREKISFHGHFSLSQLGAIGLCFVRSLVHTGLALFSSSRSSSLFHLAGALLSVGNLYQLSRWKWVKVSRKLVVDEKSQNRLKKVILHFLCLYPLYAGSSEGVCIFCSQKKPDVYVCSQHASHLGCTVKNLYAAEGYLTQAFKLEFTTTFVDERKRPLKAKHEFSFTCTDELLQHTLPCRSEHSTEAVVDLPKRDVAVDVEGELPEHDVVVEKLPKQSPSSFFSQNIQLGYGLIQVGLAFTQHMVPSLAHSIFKIQQFLMGIDLVFLAADSWDWYQTFKERTKGIRTEWKDGLILDPEVLKNRRTVALLAILEGGTLVALGAGVALALRYGWKPSGNLEELLRKSPSLSPKELQEVQLSWKAPISLQIMQWISSYRLVFSLVYAWASASARQDFLKIALLHAATLLARGKLPWVEFTRTIDRPLEKIPFRSFYLNQERFLSSHFQKLRMSVYFFADTSRLSSMLKTVYESSSVALNQLHHRIWNRNEWTLNGRQEVHYTVSEQRPSISPFEGSIDWQIFDRVYGWTRAILWGSITSRSS